MNHRPKVIIGDRKKRTNMPTKDTNEMKGALLNEKGGDRGVFMFPTFNDELREVVDVA